MTQRLLITTRICSNINRVILTQTRTLYNSEQFTVIPRHVTKSKDYSSSAVQKQSSIQRIKVVLKEYGSVAVVFHTVMSLTSLGTCYLIVDRSDNSHIPFLIHSYLIISFQWC